MDLLADALDDAVTALEDCVDEAMRAGNEKLVYVLNKMADCLVQVIVDIEGVDGC